MDADRNIIPIVEGDQGEGIMDPIDTPDGLPKEIRDAYKKALRQADDNQQAIMAKMLNRR